MTHLKIYFVDLLRYKGRTYDTCITHGNDGVPWCSINVDQVSGEHVETSVKAICPNDTCNINNCPIGFHWLAHTETCYQVPQRDTVLIYLYIIYLE